MGIILIEFERRPSVISFMELARHLVEMQGLTLGSVD